MFSTRKYISELMLAWILSVVNSATFVVMLIDWYQDKEATKATRVHRTPIVLMASARNPALSGTVNNPPFQSLTGDNWGS